MQIRVCEEAGGPSVSNVGMRSSSNRGASQERVAGGVPACKGQAAPRGIKLGCGCWRRWSGLIAEQCELVFRVDTILCCESVSVDGEGDCLSGPDMRGTKHRNSGWDGSGLK